MSLFQSSFTRFAVGALSLSAAGVGCLVAFAAACDDPHLRSDGGQVVNDSDGGCSASPGNLPIANCDNSDHSCAATPAAGCPISSSCGDPTTCLPIGDNTGKTTLDFRLRRLNIAAPPALAKQFVQSTIVTKGIDLNAKQCGELGTGLFNWIISVDTTNNVIKTGGAPPPTDPFGQGFCFAAFTTSGGVNVQPVTIPIALTGETFQTTTKTDVNIPIFLDTTLASAVILPISQIELSNVTISAGGNCIGTFNENALDSTCNDDPSSCYKWNTAGALGGYITIAQADGVYVQDLGESLCAFLTGDKDPTTSNCTRDANGNLPSVGDYCSTTKAAGGCQDSYWLAATFAASAANIFDGTGTVPACSGAVVTADAGTEGGVADAATDGGAD